MLEDLPLGVGGAHDFVEPVHVELPHEGEEVVVLEVRREDLGGQPADALYYEGVALGSPADDIAVARVLARGRSTSMMRNVLARKMGIRFST